MITGHEVHPITTFEQDGFLVSFIIWFMPSYSDNMVTAVSDTIIGFSLN